MRRFLFLRRRKRKEPSMELVRGPAIPTEWIAGWRQGAALRGEPCEIKDAVEAWNFQASLDAEIEKEQQ